MEEALKAEREATLSSQERDTNQGSALCHFPYPMRVVLFFRLSEELCKTWFLRCENSSGFVLTKKGK